MSAFAMNSLQALNAAQLPGRQRGHLLQFLLRIGMTGLMVTGAGTVSGQNFPNKPIRIVTSAPGGGADVVARIIAQGISTPLGQLVVVDNRTGGAILGDIVSKAPPDGYTLLLTG